MKLLVVMVGVLFAAEAHALTNLKKVQVTDGAQVDLLFDGKVNPAQIKTEYFNDIIQLSLTDVSVYPAKISSVSGTDLAKVFAYQYAPKLVRCRFTVRGKAESYQGRVRVRSSGKVVTVSFGGAAPRAVQTDTLTHSASQAEPASELAINEDEKRLLERVLKKDEAPAKGEAKEARADTPPKASAESRPLTGGKPLPSPARPLGMLLAVIGIFVTMALAFRRFRQRSGMRALAAPKGFSKIADIAGGLLGGLGSGRRKMIEVVASHHLGPKKSIAVVRIAGRVLVLGVANESISLITQLDGRGMDAAAELDLEEALAAEGFKAAERAEPVFGAQSPAPSQAPMAQARQQPAAGATAAGPPSFSAVLGAEHARPAQSPATAPAPAQGAAGSFPPAGPASGARARIRGRIEGMKPL